MTASPTVFLEVKNSSESEEAPAVMEQVFAALGSGGGSSGLLGKLFGKKHRPHFFSFETLSVNTSVHFLSLFPPGLKRI